MNIYERSLQFSDNADPATNGELAFFRSIAPLCRIVISAGARGDELWIHEHLSACYHLFDPDVESCTHLTTTLGKMPNVHVHNLALASCAGQYNYFADTQSIIYRHTHVRSHAIPHLVKATTLDTFCEAEGVSHIDFLKIDVEGFEVDVLRGATRMLNHCRFVQFEYGGTYLDAGTLLANVYAMLAGWRICLIEPDGLNVAKEPVDNFSYSNYVAIRPD